MAGDVLEYRVVSKEEMQAWPVDKKRSAEKQWAETTWGAERPGQRPLFYNWNIWPSRVVFEVNEAGDVACGEAVWRRPIRSARLKGLKLVSAATREEIQDARLLLYDSERVIVEFRPVSGAGLYHLYYGASEPALFSPSEFWIEKVGSSAKHIAAKPLRIEARCELDGFHPMEVVALKTEAQALLGKFPDASCLVFPEDRDRSIKLDLEIPAHWAREGPKREIALQADRNEYRVFQLGVWACREDLKDVKVAFSDLLSSAGAIHAALLQCLTLESRTKSLYIKKPAGRYEIAKGQIRALWCGIDIPESAQSGEYRGTVTVSAAGAEPVEIPIRLILSDLVVAEKGDHDLWRLSRLRWIESDIGLSDKVYPPYKPIKLSRDKRSISTWGHKFVLNEYGLPQEIKFGNKPIMAAPIDLKAKIAGRNVSWRRGGCSIEEATQGHVEWHGRAESGALTLLVHGMIEYDGCAVIGLALEAAKTRRTGDLRFTISWRKEHAQLAAGMGYRGGRREGDRVWRKSPKRGFPAAIWLGSVKAGLGWKACETTETRKCEYITGGSYVSDETAAWEDASRPDAARVRERGDAVVLELNLGAHKIAPGKPWRMQFALRPTPVKPPDARHWQFRYFHKGGGFWPGDHDTPQSYLKDNCKRLDELKALGVTRLNLHDWWGPAFNYPRQWDGPDNLSRLTEEAHKRGIFVKAYNSGRELSTLAPEFWGLVHEGTQHHFRGSYDSNPRLRFQDAWRENHLPDGLPHGWPRLHTDLGNEHSVPVSNATRMGNFYLESMRYMTKRFGADGAYWDGADGETLGHREMAKRLWTIFKETNPNAVIDVHHGNTLLTSPIADTMLCFPFIDSLWHGEGYPYKEFGPWEWLVEISGIPFGVPSETLSGEECLSRAMLFGIWVRAGWGAGTEKQSKLWAFFDKFRIEEAAMLGFWEGNNGVTIDRPETYTTAFCHPGNGVLLVIASWHLPIAGWMEQEFDVSIALDRTMLRLPDGNLQVTDIMTDQSLDIAHPIPMPDPSAGRMIWIRGSD